MASSPDSEPASLRPAETAGVASAAMSDVPARLTIENGSSPIMVSGEIDAHTAPQLAEHFAMLPDGDDIDLDMAGVDFMDSSGLRVLIEVHQRAEAVGRRLVVCRPSTSVARLIEISGLSNLLHVAE
jgi:anti-sigma B factor antagonist